MTWLPEGFEPPERVELSTGHHLRPIREVSWWVVDDEAGGELERALDELVPAWLNDTWGFRAVELAA